MNFVRNFFNQIKKNFMVMKISVKTIWDLDSPYLFLLFASMFIFIVEPFLDLFLLRNVLNCLFEKNNYLNAIKTTIFFCLIILIIHLVKSFVMWYRSNHYISFTHYFDIVHAKKGMSISYQKLEEQETRDLLMKAARGCSSIAKVGEYITNLISNIIQVLGTLLIIYSFCGNFIWVMILLAVICYEIDKRVNIKSYKNERKSYSLERKSEYFFNKMVNPVSEKEIKVYRAEEFFISKYEFFQEKLLKLKNNTNNFVLLNGIFTVLVISFELFFAYIFASKKYISENIKIGDISLYISSMTVFENSFFSMSKNFSNIGLMENRIDDYNKFLNFENIIGKEKLHIKETDNFEIEFKNVSYCYPGSDKKIINNLNLVIKKGEKLAVIGENGAGKTTFVKLLLRLYTPTSGTILLNGKNYEEYKITDYYKLFATVFQDFTLFAFTLLDNIVLKQSQEKVNMELIKEILARCEISEKIDSLKDGINTYYTSEFDSSGISLSGGECQKLAIARAWYRNSNCVILDEPTSAIDPISEEKLFNSISSLFNNKTAVLISHRLSSVRLCDRILYFENGEISEQGSHKELLKNKGKYFELYNIQSQWYE